MRPRDGDRDVDYATWKISGHIQTDAVLPSLLLPFMTDPRASIELAGGKLYKYFYLAGPRAIRRTRTHNRRRSILSRVGGAGFSSG